MEDILEDYSSAAEAYDRYDVYHVHQWYSAAVRLVCQPDKRRSGKLDDHYVALYF